MKVRKRWEMGTGSWKKKKGIIMDIDRDGGESAREDCFIKLQGTV